MTIHARERSLVVVVVVVVVVVPLLATRVKAENDVPVDVC
jgi:hypothetical protein